MRHFNYSFNFTDKNVKTDSKQINKFSYLDLDYIKWD